MTPFAQTLLYGLIGLLIVILLARVVRRWLNNRQAQAAAAPYRPERTPTTPVAPTPAVPVEHVAVVTPPPVPEYASILRGEPVNGSADAYARPSLRLGPARKVDNTAPRIDPEDIPFADRSDYSFGGATPLLAAMLPESDEKKYSLKRMLKNAGYYTPHAWQNLAATRYVGMILPILLFGVLLILVPARLEIPILCCLVAFAILGYSLPGLLVQSQAVSRIREIEQGMPDMLDMLNMCVSQGMTLPNSLHRVGVELRNVYPDLSKELAIVSDQARIAGLPAALQSFADRVDNPDVHSFTSLLMQTEQMGTSVSESLAGYSENMREGLKQRADLKGNSATFKLLFPTVLCLMPAVFLFLLGPAIVQLHDFYSGGGTDLLRQSADTLLEAQN